MKITLMGDLCFRECPEKISISPELQSILNNSDYRIVNLETPLSHKDSAPIPKDGPNLICPPSYISYLTDLQIDVAILANNHIGDFGDEALRDTINLLDSKHIRHTGAGENIEDAYKAVRLTGDVTVSVLAVCEHEFGLAGDSKPGAAAYDPRMLLRVIREEKQHADRVIVVMHGGQEYNPLPSPGEVERYRLICDLGADAVVAMHTHCPQGYEMYDGKPIVYSLGNFIFPLTNPKDPKSSWYYGYISHLHVTKDGIALDVSPYRFDNDATLHVFQGADKQAMVAYLEKISAIIQDKDQLHKHYMGWCCNHPWYVIPPESYGGLATKLSIQKNRLTCQAHREMVRENYRILNDGEEDIAKEYAEKIKELAVMPV